MFSKIDKKVLIVSAVCLIIVLLAVVLIFRSFSPGTPEIQNSVGGTNTSEPENQSTQSSDQPAVQETNESSQVQSETGIRVEAQAENGGGTLFMCEDKCGDGVCQADDPNCAQTGSCVCAETADDCPQDCK